MTAVTKFARLAVPAALATLCAVSVGAPALATPPSGVTAEDLAELELNPSLLPRRRQGTRRSPARWRAPCAGS
ncbi:hypothetical protein [Rhodococcus sp. MTM3W5.2]|uniref:hypothetical protein n=1 Tax=Rhodococcus sp. MTM3W5.2 TaxID=1805827 RepID=UPI001CB93329|nr:hypothetical protein [Rhodococcus sp. MTM3W5.2]